MNQGNDIPADHALGWVGRDLAAGYYVLTINTTQRKELATLARQATAHKLDLADITADRMPLDTFRPLLAQVSDDLRGGRGFVVLRDMPNEELSDSESEAAFWLLCSHLGRPVTQNGQGQLIGHVIDLGLKKGGNKRNYASSQESRFHQDLSDVVALYCRRQAMSGAQSRLASTLRIFERLRAERPDDLAKLERGYFWSRMSEEGPGEKPTSERPIPVFSRSHGQMTCRFHSSFIRQGEMLAHGAFDDADEELVQAMMRMANEDAVDIDFHPGDVQLVNNYTVLHARTEYEDWPEPERKRHLLRIWFEMPEIRAFADENLIRFGTVRYGNLGLDAGTWRARQAAASGTA